ncbi:MAG: hypothetical protein AVDCRST_MAG77-5911 [uncultured Chloroflexi bacterium]|uniref:Uncharacterized protein n=1 Tax=uncultured Chloroflexota bacterium TaxID=166587 RepID=A0A6J4KGI5_9CHLR|nr:MAG: hypothetical protein AVDCRST_MAG77-5911 [uncultured Chloroflexota bacterium]
MGEERYWIVRGITTTSIHPDAGGHPVHRSVCCRSHRRVTFAEPVDDLVARVTAEARVRGNVALFRDHWLPLTWGAESGRLSARAGLLADDFRPRPLPPR